MKKRNFNILISFIILTIGAYFIYALVICKKPSYELKDISGDRTAIEDLVITKKVYTSNYSYVKSIIDKDNVKIEEGSSDVGRGMDYKDIQYKDFYLGKNIRSNQKAENKDYLFSGEVNFRNAENNNVLEIRIMNKNTKDLKNVKLPFEKNMIGFVQNVNILNGKGFITIHLQDYNNQNKGAKIYSFNLETGEKINEFSIDKDVDISRLDNKIEDDYIILLQGSEEKYQGQMSGEANKLCLYDIKQNKTKTIDLKDIDSKPSIIGNSKDLYLLDQGVNKLYKVDVEKGLLKKIGSIPLDNRWISSAIVSNDRIYVVIGQGFEDNIIAIYDINNMKELYKGKIEAKNRIEMNGEVELSLRK